MAQTEATPFDNLIVTDPTPFDDLPTSETPAQGGGFFETATGLTRSVTGAMFFNFDDELVAGARAIFDQREGEDFTTAYRRIKGAINDQQRGFQRENPVLDLAGSVAGGVAGPGLAAARMGGGLIQAGGGFVSQSLRAGLVGATEGAVAGAGSADSLEDVPESAASGAAVGGLLGTAAPVAVRSAQNLMRAIKRHRDPAIGAANRLRDTLEQDGIDPVSIRHQLMEEAQRGNTDARIVDLGGINAQREIDLVAQSPGAGAQQAVRALEKRNQEALDRVSRRLGAITGGDARSANTALREVQKARAEAAKPVYAQAYAYQAELNPQIVDAFESLTATPGGKRALKKAPRILNVSNFDDQPLMIRLQAVKEAMDDNIRKLRKAGAFNEARALTRDKNALLDVVDEANPAYGQAREIWENGETYSEAVEAGMDLFKRGTTAEEVRDIFKSLSAVDREAYRTGAVSAIIQDLRVNAQLSPDYVKKLSSPEMRDKIAVLMTPKEAKDFNAFLDIERRMRETTTAATTGSQSAARLTRREYREQQAAGLEAIWSVLSMAIGGIRGMFTGSMPQLASASKKRLLERQDEVLAGLLLSRNPAELDSLLARAVPEVPNFAREARVAGTAGAVAGGDEDG